MASQIILDMTDPELSKATAAWTDGESYPISIGDYKGTATQLSRDDKRLIMDINEMEVPENAEVETQAPAKPAKPAVSVEY